MFMYTHTLSLNSTAGLHAVKNTVLGAIYHIKASLASFRLLFFIGRLHFLFLDCIPLAFAVSQTELSCCCIPWRETWPIRGRDFSPRSSLNYSSKKIFIEWVTSGKWKLSLTRKLNVLRTISYSLQYQ